jgi:hypothetical protein
MFMGTSVPHVHLIVGVYLIVLLSCNPTFFMLDARPDTACSPRHRRDVGGAIMFEAERPAYVTS